MKTKILQNTLFSFGVMFALAITAHAQNLFVGIAGDEAIFEYTPNNCLQPCSPTKVEALKAHPRGLAFDSSGNLFVAEIYQPQDIHFDGIVQKFNPRNQLSTFGNVGNSLFIGLATDSAGNVFVMGGDTSKKSLSSTGDITVSFIFKFTPSGDRIVFGSVPGQGFGLAFDSAGNLYAAADDFTIFKFASDGTRTVFIGPTAFAAGLFPLGLAFDSGGNLFVSTTTFGNPGTDAIYKFSSTGVGMGIFASGLTNARGLAFDASGNLFVTEASPFPDGDILKFAPGGGLPTVFASGLRRPQFLTFGPPR
jgi:sugar lactone lactonase YvrE